MLKDLYIRKNLITLLGLLFFPFSLPLPIPLKFKSISLILFLIVLLVNINKDQIKNVLREKPILLYGLIFLLDPITSFFRNGELHADDVRLSFIIIPIFIFVSQEILAKYKKKIFYTFVLGTYIYMFYAFCYVIYFYVNSEQHTIGFDYYLKYILYNHLPGAIHHTYLGMFFCFSSSLILFDKNIEIKNKIILNIPFFLSTLIAGSKLSFIIYCIIIIIFVLVNYKKNKQKEFFYIITFFIIGIFSLLYFINKNTDLFRTLYHSLYIRKDLYICSFEGIKENLLFGIGSDYVKDFMEKCTLDSEMRMDTHNLFLQEFLSNGILGFLTLGGIIILLLRNSLNNLKFISFMIIFIILGMVEHLLNLQLGVTFFVFFSLLFYYTPK